MVDRSDISWGNDFELIRKAPRMLPLDEKRTKRIEAYLMGECSMSKHDAEHCVDTINGCAGQIGANVGSVLSYALEGSIPKKKFRDNVCSILLTIICDASRPKPEFELEKDVSPRKPSSGGRKALPTKPKAGGWLSGFCKKLTGG